MLEHLFIEHTPRIVAKQILVVDDDGSIRELVGTLLRREGFEVEVVQSGNAAIASLTAKEYDAVVLDLMMRDGSGHDVLKTVATQRPHAKWVVVISATSAANIEAVEMANVVAKLRKPFDIHELLAAVHQCVGD